MDDKTLLMGTMGHKFVRELRQYAEISAYLYICFGALLYYKSVILNGQGITYEPYGTAAIKALVLGKFIVLGQMAGLGDRLGNRRAITVIAHKSLVFLAMLLVLSVIEEVVVGLMHGRTAAASLATFLGGSSAQVLATSVIMLLILIPYIAFGELREALGEATLRRIMFEPRAGNHPGGRSTPMQGDPAEAGGQDASGQAISPSIEKLS